VYCRVLQCVAVCCIVLQIHLDIMQASDAVRSKIVLPRVAVCCSLLQIHLDILQVSHAVRSKSVLCALQRVAVCRRYSKTPSGTVRSQGVLQCVAASDACVAVCYRVL